MVRKKLMWLVGLVLLAGGVVGLEARSKGEIVLEGVGDGQSVGAQKPSGKVVAVLVGINTYKDNRFRSLRYAEKDARDMKGYLESVGVKPWDIKLLVGKEATIHCPYKNNDLYCHSLSFRPICDKKGVFVHVEATDPLV